MSRYEYDPDGPAMALRVRMELGGEALAAKMDRAEGWMIGFAYEDGSAEFICSNDIDLEDWSLAIRAGLERANAGTGPQ